MWAIAGACTAHMSTGDMWCCRERVAMVSNWWFCVHFGSKKNETLPIRRGVFTQGLHPPYATSSWQADNTAAENAAESE